MQQAESTLHPVLRSIVVEATTALACLDADRLEELVLSCQKLNRELQPDPETFDAKPPSPFLVQKVPYTRPGLPIKSVSSMPSEMAIFSRLLSLTQENLAVLARSRNQQGARLEYSEREAGIHWPAAEVQDGEHQ